MERLFQFVGHAENHGSGPCSCPPDWPRDLMPGDCRACYDEHGASGVPRGVSVPVEQCARHRGGRLG